MATSVMASGDLFRRYAIDGFFDEMFAGEGVPRAHYAHIFNEFALCERRNSNSGAN
jgi:hypothetical protein